MTLQQRIDMIDLFIKREPDATIKDYLEAVEEFEMVEKTMNRYDTARITIKTRPLSGSRPEDERSPAGIF